MPGIFDDTNFTLLQTPEQLPSVMESIMRNRDPAVAAQTGAVSGPQLAALNAQPVGGVGGSVTPQSMAGGPTAQQSGQPQPQPPQQTSGGGKPEPTREEMLKELMDKTMKDLHTTKKVQGPDLFKDAGGPGHGLLGSGISPLSAILFGLGAVATRRASPATAWGVSLKLAGLPQEYEHAQQQAAHQTVQTLLSQMQAARQETHDRQQQEQLAQTKPIRDAVINQMLQDIQQPGGRGAPAQPGTVQPQGGIVTPPGTTYTPLQGEPEQISQAGALPGAFAQAAPTAPAQQAAPPATQRRLNYSMDLGGGLRMSSPEVGSTQQPGMSASELKQMHPTMTEEQAALLSRFPWPVQNAEVNRLKEAKTASDIALNTREILKAQGIDPSKATPGDIARAHVIAQKEAIAQAGARAGATQTGRFEAKDLEPPPTKPDEKYIRYNPASGGVEYAPGALSAKQLRDQGFRSVSGKSLEKVTAAEGINNTWSILKSRAQQIQGIPAIKLWASANTGGNYGGPEGANYKAALLDTTIQLDKLWGGVRGAASPSFREATAARFPQFIDHPNVVGAKTRMMDVVIDTLRDENIRSVTGAPQDPQMYQKIRNAMLDYDRQVGNAGGVPQAGGAVTPPAGAKVKDYTDFSK